MMLCVIGILSVFIVVVQKYAKNKPWFLKLKNKLMWSSVFRSVI